MKQILVFTYLFSFSLTCIAQGQGDANFILNTYRGERRAILLSHLDLEKGQISQFNEIYTNYETKRQGLDELQAEAIGGLIDKEGIVSDEEATTVAQKYFAYHHAYHKLQKKCFKQLADLLGAKKALRFVQVDEYLEHITRMELSKVLPNVQKGD